MATIDIAQIQKTQAELQPEAEELLETLTAHPELAGDEHQTIAYLGEFLAKHGFEVESGYLGEPTGFKAVFRRGEGAHINFFAKYDALPKFMGGDDAHGCGHNWVGVHSVFSAVVTAMNPDFSGTVSVIGAPTERFFGPKVDIRHDPFFDEVDAVFHSHLNDKNLLYSFAAPVNTLEFRLTGRASQAFSYPHEGVNALNAASDIIQAIRSELLAEPRDFDRINYIITEGGISTESVPARTVLRIALSGAEPLRTEELMREVIGIGERICAEQGVGFEHELVNEFPTLVNIPEIHDLAGKAFENNGAPYRVLPEVLGRTALDVASISQHCPMLFMFFGVPNWVSHQPTPGRVDASHAPEAKEALGLATRVFAEAALNIAADAALRDRLWEAHREQSATLADPAYRFSTAGLE
ncbi:MAG: peptidase dimerization domain-containing protein [Microbacterium sp.]